MCKIKILVTVRRSMKHCSVYKYIYTEGRPANRVRRGITADNCIILSFTICIFTKYQDNIKLDIKKTGCRYIYWIQLTQDRDQEAGLCEHDNK
jgi:hypothetical protein